jgi:hypothetical protein
MQRAARAVALENERLRVLLAHHGVSQDEINAYLSSSESISRTPDSCSSRQSNAGGSAPKTHKNRQRVTVRPNSKALGEAAVDSSALLSRTAGFLTSPVPCLAGPFAARPKPSEPDSPSTPPASSVNSNFAIGDAYGEVEQEACQCPKSRDRDSACNSMPDLGEPQDMLPPIYDHRWAPRSPSPILNSTEMSCEAAAHILAELQGHRDPEQARDDLGCTGTSDCLVRNTELFRLMDRMDRTT